LAQFEQHDLGFWDSSINFILYFLISDITKVRVRLRSEIMDFIWDKFKENNIELPFPQMDVKSKRIRYYLRFALNRFLGCR